MFINFRRAVHVYLMPVYLFSTLGIVQTHADESSFADAIAQQKQRVESELGQLPRPRADLQKNVDVAVKRIPTGGENCVTLNQIDIGLAEEFAGRGFRKKFSRALDPVTQGKNSVIGECIGAEGISGIAKRVQSELLSLGYLTTRVDVRPQDFSEHGILVISFIPGLISSIRYSDEGELKGRKPLLKNSMALNSQDLFNVRNLETSLENYQRLSSVEVSVDIQPSSAVSSNEAGYSDIVINWHQNLPISGSISVDDSGSDATGIYQTALFLTFENGLRLNDVLSIYLNTDVPEVDDGPTEALGMNFKYSVPIKSSVIELSYGDYEFDETLEGLNQDISYRGQSRDFAAEIKHLFYRDKKSKVYASIGGFQKSSKNFIEDEEVLVQRRRVSGWVAGLEYLRSTETNHLYASLAFQQGTGAFNALKAPEEEFNEGVSRPKIWDIDVQFNQPIYIGVHPTQYRSKISGQFSDTPLIPQDRFLIGGRYSVRGVKESISAEKGFYLQQELGYAGSKTPFNPYIGLDYGLVDGPSIDSLSAQDRQILSTVLGVRARFRKIYTDAFIGTGLLTPSFFEDSFALGFSATLNF